MQTEQVPARQLWEMAAVLKNLDGRHTPPGSGNQHQILPLKFASCRKDPTTSVRQRTCPPFVQVCWQTKAATPTGHCGLRLTHVAHVQLVILPFLAKAESGKVHGSEQSNLGPKGAGVKMSLAA